MVVTAGSTSTPAQDLDVPSETTPLIAAENAGPTAQADVEAVLAIGDETIPHTETSDDDRPLPIGQVLALCYIRVVEPIAFFSIFPFINKMILEAGTPEADVGFYSGLIESLFSMTQMLVMISWGRLADRAGRRPVLIASTLGVGVGMTAFGFSKTVWQLILCRCFAGLFSGSIVTIRAMFGEISTPKTQARAFSYFAVAGNIGIVLGPVLGGALADPVHQYPKLFGGNAFFTEHPYSAPMMATGIFALSAAFVSYFFLEETLHAKGDGAKDKAMSTWEILRAPGVSIVLLIYSVNMVLPLGFTAVAPVFWFTSVDLGGYGFTPLQISFILGASGVSQALYMLFVFPPWQTRVGTGKTLRVMYWIYPGTMLLPPLAAILLRTGHVTLFWLVAVPTVPIGASVAMTFTAVQLALNDIAPSPNTLGVLNGLAMTIVAGIRAFAPAGFASLFAFGVGHRLVYGYFVWVILFALALTLPVLVRWLPAKAAGGPVVKKDQAQDEE